jgi:hypothetical protein
MSENDKTTELQQALRSPSVPKAAQVGVAYCDKDGCQCGQIYIHLVDETQSTFAIAPMSDDVACDLAAELLKAVEHVRGKPN